MGSKPVEIATRAFGSQKEATAFFKAMLNRYTPGEKVSDEDALDLIALLPRHSEFAVKIGSGVGHFEVVMTEEGTPCFRIVRVDGTGTDFSYLHCISGRSPSRKQEVSQALRRSVRIDLYTARDTFFVQHRDANGMVSCAETGASLRLDEGHMDHRAPMTFEVIVATFLASRGISFDDVPITSGRDDQTSPELTDSKLSEDFRQYHARVALLDYVKSAINLGQSSRQRMKPARIVLDSNKT